MKKLWEKHREETLVPPTFTTFSYEGISKEPKELDTFGQIAQSLRQVAWPTSEDEFEDYNSQEPYDPSKGGSYTWWSQDIQR